MASLFSLKRLNSVEDMTAIQKVEQMVWESSPALVNDTVAAIRNGGIAIGAYINEEMVGFIFAFPGYKNGTVYLHSHKMGVNPNYRKLGIGRKLKEMELKIANDIGYRLIDWTFDPLEGTNAYLNLHRLHAIAPHYIENCYGPMDDKLNYGLPTDRFIAEWWIASKHVNKEQPWLSKIKFDENKVLLRTDINKEGLPIIISRNCEHSIISQETDNEIWFLPIPSNFQQIKKVDAELAKSWRLGTRSIFKMLMNEGYTAADVLRISGYTTYFYIFVKKERLSIGL